VRTTVTLDPDTEQIVRARMEADGVSFKQALNDAIRRGAGDGPRRSPFVQRTFDMGAELVDLTHASRVAAELEDDAIIERMRADG
jgi:hypothetical protein